MLLKKDAQEGGGRTGEGSQGVWGVGWSVVAQGGSSSRGLRPLSSVWPGPLCALQVEKEIEEHQWFTNIK